jgi:hypothetical protein
VIWRQVAVGERRGRGLEVGVAVERIAEWIPELLSRKGPEWFDEERL